MRWVIGFLLLSIMLVGHALIYQQTDTSGHVTYSDEPLENDMHPIDISTAQSASDLPAVPPVIKTNVSKSVNFPNYNLLMIVSPKVGETFQNVMTIPVVVKLEPDLQTGDTLQLFVDGQPWQAPSKSTKLTLFQLERGTHEIYVTVNDQNKVLLKKSNSITFFVHRASAINR